MTLTLHDAAPRFHGQHFAGASSLPPRKNGLASSTLSRSCFKESNASVKILAIDEKFARSGPD